jgi:hypothetical protein
VATSCDVARAAMPMSLHQKKKTCAQNKNYRLIIPRTDLLLVITGV